MDNLGDEYSDMDEEGAESKTDDTVRGTRAGAVVQSSAARALPTPRRRTARRALR